MIPSLALPHRRSAGPAFTRWVCAAILLAFALGRGVAAAAPGDAAATTPAARAGTQYALIVNGDDSFTHNLNVQMALDALPRLGYAPAHTLLLAAGAPHGEDPTLRRLPATVVGIDQAMDLLRRELGPHDLLLVYLTGHGGRAFGRPFLELESGLITAPAFVRRLSPLPFAELILIADQCYSGGFLDEAARLGRDVVGAASADSRHEVRCEPFIRPFWIAATQASDAGAGSDAVSVEQAFRAGVDSQARGLEAHAQYLAVGKCQGHQNRFGIDPVPR
jgi:hypothetical protein